MCSLKDGLRNDMTFQISDSEKQRKISKIFECVLFAATYAFWQRVKDARGSAKNSAFCLYAPAKTVSNKCSFCSSGLIIRRRKECTFDCCWFDSDQRCRFRDIRKVALHIQLAVLDSTFEWLPSNASVW